MTVTEKIEFDRIKKELEILRLQKNAQSATNRIKDSLMMLFNQRLLEGTLTQEDQNVLRLVRQEVPTSVDCLLELLNTDYLRLMSRNSVKP